MTTHAIETEDYALLWKRLNEFAWLAHDALHSACPAGGIGSDEGLDTMRRLVNETLTYEGLVPSEVLRLAYADGDDWP